MQKNIKKYLLLEQLEERIFLDANPIAAVDPVDPIADPTVVLIPINPPQAEPLDSLAGEPEPTPENSAQELAAEPDEAEDASSNTAATVQEEDGDGAQSVSSEDTGESGLVSSDGIDDIEQTTVAEAGSDTQQTGVEIASEPSTPAQIETETGDASGLDITTVIAPVDAIDPMIGEDFTFTVSLDNTTGSTLYGPYIDLYFESSGDDGDGDGIIFGDNNGNTSDAAQYLGTSVTNTILTYDGSNPLLHPYAVDGAGDPLVITTNPDGSPLQANDTLVVLEMPFGSFTPGQPEAEVVITAHISDYAMVDSGGGDSYDLDVQVANGFRYGTDALDNPSSDPSITYADNAALLHPTQTFRPEVIRFSKDYIGPEQETATGPNYVRQYSIDVDVADGQTVTNLQVIENLPDNIWYLGDGTVTEGTVSSSPGIGVHSGQQLIIDLGTVAGGPGVDATVTFDYYVPYIDAASQVIVARDDGDANDDETIINDMQLRADWDPTDPDDGPVIGIEMDAEVDEFGNISTTPANDEEFDAQAIAIQKGVEIVSNTGVGGYNPGDIVKYTLNFQVSDYFNVGNIVATDILPDGLDFLTESESISLVGDNRYAPVFDIDAYGVDYSGAWNYGDELVETIIAGDDVQLVFNISDVAGYGPDGILRGSLSDVTDNSQDGSVGAAAGGTITYYALIREQYDSEASGNAVDDYIDQGDTFSNAITIDGTVYSGDPGDPDNLASGDQESDGSEADFSIETGSVIKSVYAINSANPDPDGDGVYHMQPGDIVTYRLTYTMPTSDVERFLLDDYLPLPVIDVDDQSFQTGVDGGSTPVLTTSEATSPASGHIRLLDTDTFSSLRSVLPVVSFDSDANNVSFTYAASHDDTSPETVIDIVFSVTVNDEPFTDGLYLTNQVRATEDGTPGVPSSQDQIIQIVLDQPVLVIDKSASPFSGIDAGDTVAFSVEVLNSGHAPAFDTRIKDTLPDGFDPVIAAATFNVVRGGISLVAGTDYVWSGGGIDNNLATANDNFFADPGPDGIYGNLDDGYAGGIELVDVGGNVALAASESIIISYTLVAADTIQPGQSITNTATITNFAGAEGATDHTIQDITDDATVTSPLPTVVKAVTDTSETSTPGLVNVVVGETVEYTVTITVPEGEVNDFVITDTLDSGLAIVSLDSIGVDAGLTTDNAGDWNGVLTDAQALLASPGRIFTVDFGNVTNTAAVNNGADEQITITYTAVVLNVAGNQQNTRLDNVAYVSWDDPNSPGNSASTSNVNSPDVIVQEADLQIVKEVWDPISTSFVDADTISSAVNYDQGDTVMYQITIDSADTHSFENAFDVVFTDTIPGILDTLTAIVTFDSGLAPTSFAYNNVTGDITATWDDFDVNQSSVFLITGTLPATIAGQEISNTGTVTWESLDSDLGTPLSAYSSVSYERTGDPNDPGGADNDYTDSDQAFIAITGGIDKIDPASDIYTIGDTITYTINVTVPDGTTNDLVVTDALPNGMIYSGGSAISDPGTFNGSDITSPSVSVAGGDGGDITFSFGDVIADDFANNDNTFTIRFDARVTNIPSNFDDPDGTGVLEATSLLNHVSMSYTDPANPSSTITIDDPTDPVVSVIEPWIVTTKTVNQSTGVEAGDILTYTVTLANSGNATAYEVNFNDTLAPGTSMGSIQSAVRSDGIAVSNGTAVTQADSSILFSADDWDLDPTETLTITYTVNVTSVVLVDGTHTNTVDADWSSQDGNDPNERVYDENDGIDSPVDDGSNADRDTDNAVFSMDPVTIAKSDGGITQATIGDTITYTLTINSPQGTIDNFVVEDVLAEGLIFNNDATITSAGFSYENTTIPTYTPTNDGSTDVTITWNLGDTVVSTDDPLIITYTALVADVSRNFYNEGLSNSASIEYDNAQGVHQTPAPVIDGLTVSEPWILTEKTVNQTSGVEAGDTLTYTMRLTNGGNDTAHEVNFNDTLAPGTSFDAVQTATIGLSGVSLGTASESGGIVSFSDDTWDLAPGEILTLTYTVNVTSAALVDGAHTNTVDADWSSQDGNDPNERVYDENDGIDSPVDDGSNADRDTDNAVFSMDPVTIAKSDGGMTQATIGDTITYTLTINSPQGTIDSFVVEDVLAEGLIFNNDATITSAGFTYENTTIPSFTPTNDGSTDVTITWDLGDTVVSTDDPLIITYTALVADVGRNFLGEGLGNTASIEYDNAQGVPQTPAPVTDGLTVTEPQITTTKSVADSPDAGSDATPGEILTYTARFTNTGNADAFEVNGVDTLATGTEFIALSSAFDNSGTDLTGSTVMSDNGDGTISIVGDWDIAVNDWVEIQYTVTVLSAGFTSGNYTNTVDADWTNQDGPVGTERTYNDTGTSPVDADQDTDDAVFTVSPTGSLGDTLFFDANGDGGPFNSAAGDVGISGVNITISADVDGDGTLEFSQSVLTNASGQYSFNNLAAYDDYIITVDYDGTNGSVFNLAAAGYAQTYDLDENASPSLDNTASSISLAPGQNRTDIDFGYTGQNTVGDTVWYDLNADGVQDADENGIDGLTVTLTGDIDGDGIGEFTASTSTASDGTYFFNNLPAGSFDITVTPPTASTPTYDFDSGTGSPDNTSPFVLGANADNLDIDFGLRGTGMIGDYIWYDADGDGIQNEAADAGIANVTVTISGDIDSDGIEEYTDSTITADDGSYSFDFLLGGIYTITVDDTTLPAGMSQTADPDSILDSTTVVSLADGETDLDQDFGYTGLNSAGDTVWFDLNNNGIQDAGEDGIGNVDVIITADIDGDGITEYSSTTTTDGDGLYTFTNLPAGDYIVSVDPTSLPPGAVQTYDLDDGLGASNNQTIFTMDGASDRDDVDFGYRGTGSLGDFVWYDANFDGIQNDGALPGLESVIVILTGDIDGDTTIDYTSTFTTGTDGSYSFDNLLGGSYTVTIDTSTLPGGSANWRQTFDLDDTTGPFTTADNAAATELGINGAALNRTDVDFGYTGNSSIGDTIFFDADNSGSQTGGDTGITDVLVTLTADIDGDGTPDFSWTDITDASGLYLFENLPAFDSYTVTVDPANLPPGTVPTYDLDGIDSENSVSGIMLGVAENRNDVDFGYFSSGTGSIGDTVWYDSDADGVLDAGEQGLAGVNLILTGDITGDGLNDISFATTTDENGLYQFNNLLPGDYTVTVNPVPAGMEQTFDIDGLGTANAASLSLADGENNNNVDFGYTGSGSIGDTIYFDADNSASETAGDGYIPGVTVTLAGDVNNDGIEDVLTTTTDTNGYYLFANLPDGDYTITVNPTTLPAGMSQTGDPDGVNDDTSAITLAGGADVLDQDFGYIGSGSIGDTIWDDDDGDGTQNGAEGGLSGVDVSISVDFDGDGTPDYTETTTTDGNGNYSFDNLPAGEYTISVETDTLPPTYILTGDPDSNPDSTSTVNLPAGGTNLDQDFGYQDTGLTTGSIGDTIYFDTDGSGAQTGGEPGISGVTVSLSGDIDGDGASENVNTTTDLNGNYLFDNLPAGDYTITVNPATLPAGMIQTADPDGGNDNSAFVALAAGEDNTLQDFGYNGTGSIGDTIFFDGNNNGIQESNEGGIDNVQVELNLDLNGDGIADYTETITTDSDGNYLFEELPAGEYTITVDTATLPSGMIQSSDPDGSLDDMTSYNLSGGENNLNQDFGYTGTGAIGDTIWNDADGDGAQGAGETGLSGVAVSIEADIDGDGISDYTETIVTDSNGNYLFGNLPAGNYTITVDPATLPIGYSQSGDPDGTNDNATTLILVADENNLDQDFGYNSGTGSIGDTIFFDVNGNGTQDGSESGLPGVTVSLTGDVDGDGIPDTITTATDSSGAYLFDGLPAGDYTITVDPTTLPDGMNQTADPDGVNDNTADVTLAADEDNQDQDFGYQGTGSIGDTIWNDSNGDGILNGSEGALPGPGIDITLTIDFDGNGTVDYTQSTTTNGSGNYLFDNLPAGDYTISVDTADIPGGYVLTADPDGNPDSTTGLTLAAEEDNLNQDFGYSFSGNPTGSIGDTIYFDENNNGTQDGADVGLPGVSVTLAGDIDGDGSTDSVSTTTDANGNYLFDNLPAGDYTVSVDPATLPGGMNQTDDPDGVNDNNSTVTLPPGIDDDAQDFGYTGSSVIGDTIYFDTNGNGVQDSGENGLPGVDVSISVDFDGDGSPDYTSTTTTDGNGNYSFDNLPAGEYTVSVNPGSLPNDVRPSGDPDGTLDNTTTLVLGPSETNNDQDFGYTGTGSIGDTVYYDADGNGFQSPGERGLGGVTVTLQGDFDNDGTIEAVTTTTDGNGTYLFENLTTGVYTVYIDTTTLPGGLTQTGDPDATLDNQSTVTLSAGETNLAQDFGYSGPSPFPPPLPPQPEIPVVPLTPPSPLPSPVPIAPPDQGLVADAFFMYRQFGDRIDTEIFNREEMLPWQSPILPVSPMYTGHTEPGTTIQLVLYDALGNQIGYESVMADTAGNWMADFPETIMYELPHRMEIVQTKSSYNASSAGFFNMRTYFAPSFSSMVYAHTRLDVEAVFAYMPSAVIETVHHSNLSPFDITWNDFNGYEFVAPSTNPAQDSH